MKKLETGEKTKGLLSNNLRRLRVNANLSQTGLAAGANLAQNFVNDIENGKKWVSCETIEKLADILQVEPYQFLVPESQWSGQGAELFELCIQDLKISIINVIDEYHSRFFSGDSKDSTVFRQ